MRLCHLELLVSVLRYATKHSLSVRVEGNQRLVRNNILNAVVLLAMASLTIYGGGVPLLG